MSLAVLSVLGLSAALLSPSAVTAASAEISNNLYEQTAISSGLASHSLMLDVADTGDRLVSVGERGFILISDDAGRSWQQIQSPVSVTLTRVVFATPQQGWAVGHAGVVLHTKDGGLTWQKQLDGMRIAELEVTAATDAYNLDPNQENEFKLKMAKRLVEDGPDKPLLNLYFSDAHNGMVIGAYGLALTTEDGGASWHSISNHLDNPSGLHLYDIIENNGTLYIAGEQGLLLASYDGGGSFEELNSPSMGSLFGLVSTENGAIVIYGLRGGIYLSEDSGDSWQEIPNRLPITITAGARLQDGSLLLLDESGRTLRSSDNGHSFSATPIAEPTYLTGLTQTQDGELILTGLRGPIRLAEGSHDRES
ncbi:WD40/YVTN/BNR-like repeat-containing protein [Marinobacterium lutimaris]|nr:YCF48-related protein [Marinobacterium lutimaris]